MSKLVKYSVPLPIGEVTVDHLLAIMEAMGLKPVLHSAKRTVKSWTEEDSFAGNLTFKTHVLGGMLRQKDGVSHVAFDEVTRVITSELVLRIDIGGLDVSEKVQKMSDDLGSSLAKLALLITDAMTVSKQKSVVLPGLTVREAREIALGLGARVAPDSLCKVEGKINLARSFLGVKSLKASRVKTAKPAEEDSILMQIGPKPITVSLDIPRANGHGKIRKEIGIIPPVMALKAVKGGVQVSIAQHFFDQAQAQLQNIQRLAMAQKLVESQAAQNVGTDVLLEVSIENGQFEGIDIEWEKEIPEEEQNPVQQVLAERQRLVSTGQVKLTDREASDMKVMITSTSKGAKPAKPLDREAIRERILEQSKAQHISQFVLA